MSDFVPRTETSIRYNFTDMMDKISFKNGAFSTSEDEYDNIMYIMNEPSKIDFTINADSRFVFGSDFDINDYDVMLYASAYGFKVIFDIYPLSQIVGSQTGLTVDNNVFTLSQEFKDKVNSAQAVGMKTIAVPYNRYEPNNSDFVLENIELGGTVSIMPTEDMYNSPLTYTDEIDTRKVVEVELEFYSSMVDDMMFIEFGSNQRNLYCDLIAMDKYFYNGLDKTPAVNMSLCPYNECVIENGVLSLKPYKQLTISESVQEISMRAFANSSLMSVKIPETVTTIHDEAFMHSTNLKKIEIPSSVTSIGKSAFEGCWSLTSIKCDSSIAPKLGEHALSLLDAKGTLYHPKNSDYTSWMIQLPDRYKSKAIEDGSDTTDEQKYLSFEAVEDGLTIGMINRASYGTLEYKIGHNGDWHVLDKDNVTEPINQGQKIYFKGNLSRSSITDDVLNGIGTFVLNKKANANGSPASIITYDNMQPYQFAALFKNCDKLITPPKLGGISLTPNCFERMFEGCTSLTKAPSLHATTLTDFCYYLMFDGCSSLTEVPELPATQLKPYCYAFMFRNCSSLTKAPQLNATALAPNCYAQMFEGCTSLVDVQETLPAKILQSSCYFGMFFGCSSLTKAPTIEAIKLADYCCGFMYQNCTSLVEVPSILPCTRLATNCYAAMFIDCTSLTTAPMLPATNLVNGCYNFMFQGCSSLNYITAMFEADKTTECCYAWVQGVGTNGVFVKSPTAQWNVSGVNGVPNGWLVRLPNDEDKVNNSLTHGMLYKQTHVVGFGQIYTYYDFIFAFDYAVQSDVTITYVSSTILEDITNYNEGVDYMTVADGTHRQIKSVTIPSGSRTITVVFYGLTSDNPFYYENDKMILISISPESDDYYNYIQNPTCFN